jgi:Activator of Hsp90 ATPase homolog 1-like protein
VNDIAALRREILVAADPQVAFRVFVERIGQWWPLAEHSVYGAEASVSFDGDDLVEIAPDGQRCVWGSVTAWHPGDEVAFTWHPGGDAARASHVTVTFRRSGEQTLVTLVHRGWEVFADPTAARAEYEQGWPTVLGRYRDQVTAAA